MAVTWMTISRIVDLRAIAGLYRRHRGILRDVSGRTSTIDAILWTKISSISNHDNTCYVNLINEKQEGKNNCSCPLA